MTEVPDFWGVQEDVYCAVSHVLRHFISGRFPAFWVSARLADLGLSGQGKEEVFHFLESVLTEVMELFPSQYIHIGGDEVLPC